MKDFFIIFIICATLSSIVGFSIYQKVELEKEMMLNSKYNIGEIVVLKITGEKCQILDKTVHRRVLKYEIRLAGEGEKEIQRDGIVSKSSRTLTVPRSTIWVKEFELQRR